MQLFPKASQLNQNMVLIYPIQYCIMWNPFFFMISNFFLFRRKIWILTDKWKWTVLRKVKAKFKCVLQSSSKKGRVILVSSLFVKFHLCSTVRAARRCSTTLSREYTSRINYSYSYRSSYWTSSACLTAHKISPI